MKPDWRTTLSALAGLVSVLLVAAGLFYTNEANRAQEQANLRGQAADRFTTAIDQIGQEGSDKLSIRLGGIYALGRLMVDFRDNESDVINVLTAFIRAHSKKGTGVPAVMVDVQTALTVIARRPHPDADGTLELSDLSLNMAGLNLNSANLSFTDLSNSWLYNARLENSILRNSDLSSTYAAGLDLEGAKLDYATMTGANFENANLGNASLLHANLSGADLHGIQLSDANLVDTRLFLADLSFANLEGANLDGADLSDTNLADASLRFANLTNVDLNGSNPGEALLDGANFSGATNMPSISAPPGARLPSSMVTTSPGSHPGPPLPPVSAPSEDPLPMPTPGSS